MVALNLSKVFILAAVLGQAWGVAVDLTIAERDHEVLEGDIVERHDLNTAILTRSNLGDNVAYTSIKASGDYGGGFWYQEVDSSTATSATDEQVYAAAKNGWTQSVAKAKAAKKPEASIGCALFIPGKGWVIDTSLKAVGQDTQSLQTCNVVTDFNHKNWANCAEMNALAIMIQKGWSIPASGAKMACYGNYGKADVTPKWVNPCSQGSGDYPGCKETIKNDANWKKITVLPAKSG